MGEHTTNVRVTRAARDASPFDNNAAAFHLEQKFMGGLPPPTRSKRGRREEEEDIEVLSSAVVLLTSDNPTNIETAITGEPEQANNVASGTSELSVASVTSIQSIARSGTDELGLQRRLTAFFSITPEETPRLAALHTLIKDSFGVTSASFREFFRSSASGGKSLAISFSEFIRDKYTEVLMPYLESLSVKLKSLNPRKTYDGIYGMSNNVRAAILAIRHSFSLGSVIVPIIKSVFVSLGTAIYNGGDAFIDWLQSQSPPWLTNFLEMLVEAGSEILRVSADSALGMGDSTEVAPVLIMIVVVLAVLDKFGPGPGIGDRLIDLITNAFTKLTNLGEAIITYIIRLGERGFNLALRIWNSTRQIREYYTRAVGGLHLPFYVAATFTVMSARILYLGFINLYRLVSETEAGLKHAGDRQAVERAAGILERLQGDAQRGTIGKQRTLEISQTANDLAQALIDYKEDRLGVDEFTERANAVVEQAEPKLTAEHNLTEEARAQIDAQVDLLLEEAEEAEEESEAKRSRKGGGARKSKSRRRRGPTVNKKQKKSRRYKRSNKGGSRKSKKATKKRRN